MMKLKHKKQSRIDKLGESLLELHGDLEVHKRRGSSYKLIDALGLTEKKDMYNHLSDVVWKLVYRYLDTSHSLSHQSDKLLVEKVIRRAQAESEILMRCEGGWGAHALIAQVLKNQSTSERRQKQNAEARRKREESNDEDEEEVGADNAGANRHIKRTLGTQKKRKRDKSKSESEEVDTDDASDNRHIKCTSGTHKKRKRSKSKSESDSESESEEMDTGDASDNRHIKHTSDTQKKRKRDNSQSESKEMYADNAGASNRHSKHTLGTQRKMERDEDDDEDDNDEDEDERSVYPKRMEARQKMRKSIVSNDDIQPNMHAKGGKGHQCLGGTQKNRKRNELVDESIDDQQSCILRAANGMLGMEQQESISNGSCTPRPLASIREQADEAEVPAASECHDGSQKKKRDDMSLGLQHGHNFETVQLGAQICTMIKREHRKYKQLKIAVKKGWPISTIDFKQIPGCIIKWRDQLDPILCNRSLHEQQHVWKCFEADLVEDGWTLEKLACMQNSALCSGLAILDHLHAG
ncbi:hypothetical protein M404DRAFT_9907 [Pisolithus tinctorius Marx 270]|uniref:Uncharacterized protein n=1 Tax=Pisolithus tinctorius Marx 270 TaxID=870435 RepID=A0A0C3P3V5_PISTI|nr:hypothetical protein M404DRAFT_9907 [Pisolithus tinctorius Marx 270]